MQKPNLSFWQIWNMSFGFFGIQIGFALQNANMSRIFQTLGAPMDTLPLLWLAGPVTGLLVQPVVGYFSDRTWNGLGRRRPYFLAGAILTTMALFIMPNSPYLWVAAGMLWILDSSLNITMEPFRAFVGDMLNTLQRTRGYAMQGVFIGLGAFLASFAPQVLQSLGVSGIAAEGIIPDDVKYSFYIGAVLLFAAVMWTVLKTKEYSPEQLSQYTDSEPVIGDPSEFQRSVSAPFFISWGSAIVIVGLALTAMVAAYGMDKQFFVLTVGAAVLGLMFVANGLLKKADKDNNFFSHILSDLVTMPTVMKQLALVQFLSWAGLFMMWIYATPAITQYHYAATDVQSVEYATGAAAVSAMFGIYNLFAAAWAFIIPTIAKAIGNRKTHAFNLICGAAGISSLFFISDPAMIGTLAFGIGPVHIEMPAIFALSMIGVGIAWASILTVPYSILADALPSAKMGIYMGVFNFFIVLPQIIVGGVMGVVIREFFGNVPINAMLLSGVSFAAAAIAVMFVTKRDDMLIKTESA